ncbi:MAG: hypothetical protein PHN37_03190, partial [Candidatus Pacebacteria bacterium]|nr:hypothetical protein [Candidatus Paceibacterota bacterium]
LASGLLLTDYGARSQTREGERKSASIYYSGSSTSIHGLRYADQVLIKADCIQTFVNTNTMSVECQRLISVN